MLPDIAIQIILALLLFFLTFQAANKVVEIYRKENKAIKEKEKKERVKGSMAKDALKSSIAGVGIKNTLA